jgi:hypothetical protein
MAKIVRSQIVVGADEMKIVGLYMLMINKF